MLNSINNFYSPTKHFAKVAEKFEAIMNEGLTETVVSCLSEYVVTHASSKASQAEGEDVPMQSALIDTSGPQGA